MRTLPQRPLSKNRHTRSLPLISVRSASTIKGLDHMDGRRVSESTSEYSELALPNDANGLGNLLGGKIMHLVDLAGAIAAMKHCRNVVWAAAVDHMDFINPVRIKPIG